MVVVEGAVRPYSVVVEILLPSEGEGVVLHDLEALVEAVQTDLDVHRRVHF